MPDPQTLNPAALPCRWYRVPRSFTRLGNLDPWPCWLIRVTGVTARVLFVDGTVETVGARNVRRERDRDALLDREAAYRLSHKGIDA